MVRREGRTGPPDLSAYQLVPPLELVPLPHTGVNNTTLGIHTGNGRYVWKSYTSSEDAAALAYEHTVLHWLAARALSFAVPAPVQLRDGGTLQCDGSVWTALTPWLPGTRLDPTQPDQIEWFGAAVGELLRTLQEYPPIPRPGRSLFGALFDFPAASHSPFAVTPAALDLPDTPSYSEPLAWWRNEARSLQAWVDTHYRTLPWQVCHNDVAPGNVLIDDGHVSAILDFEFATLAPRALDVAMGLRMIMRVWENPEPWEAVRRFCRGLQRWLPLREEEIRAMPWLIRLRGAITVLWWLGRPDGPHDPRIVLERIAFLRSFVQWLDQHEAMLVETLLSELR